MYRLPQTKVVRVSGDRKTGPVSATYRPVGPTCPLGCGLLDDGCYAQRGRVNMHQAAAADDDGDLDQAAGMDLLRLMVSGGWFRRWGAYTRLDVAYVRQVIAWHAGQPRTHGWSYTHDWEVWDRAGVGPDAWPPNLTILASCDDLPTAQAAQAAGWTTARVIDSPADRAENEIACPYDKAKSGGTVPDVTCRTCRLCWEPPAGRHIAFLKI
jgi:hypothetical protein